MKKYIRLNCTVCKRFVDKIVDNQRVTPDKCTITLDCQGRLVPVEYRSNGEIATNPEVGITDWYPRNRTITTFAGDAAPVLIDTSTGTYQQIVLGIPLASPPTDTATAALDLLLQSDSPKAFRQYTYRFDTTFQTVSGVESGLSKKTLRFTAYGLNADIVEVYVNGVKQEQGPLPENYQVYDGTISSPVPPNTVAFNAAVVVSGTAQVDIIVSKAEVTTTTTLTFLRNVSNEARKDKGAWENVSYYDRLIGAVWTRFYLFTCDIAGNLALTANTIMVPTNQVLVNDTIPTSHPLGDVFLQLARKPYSQVDRYIDTAVKLDAFSIERDYFKYHVVNSVLTLELTDTTLGTFYPPARLTKFDYEPTIKTTLHGNEEQIVVDGKVVVGPDE